MSTNSENGCNEKVQKSNKRSENTINRMKGKQYKGLTKGIISEKAPSELKAGCTSKFHVSIRPGKKSGEPTVHMIRALGYDPSGIIYYKTSIRDNNKLLPHRTQQKFKDIEASQLLTERIPIS